MKKILAIVAMLTLTLSMACAAGYNAKPWTSTTDEVTPVESLEIDAWSGAWCQVDEGIESVTFKVTCPTAAEKWDDFEMFIVDSDNEKTKGEGTYFAGVTTKTEYEFTVKLADIKNIQNEKGGFNIQAGQAPITVSFVCNAAAGNDGADEGGKTETTPSETGDVMNIALLSVVAVLAFAGVVVSSKKRA